MNNPYANTTKEIKPPKPLEARCILDPYLNVPFPQDAFPDRIREICDHLNEINGTPLEMLYFCAAGIVAGIAGDRFQLVGAIRNYRQYPNQFFVSIGESSAGKSTALEPLMRAIHRSEAETYNLYKQAVKNKTDATDSRFIMSNITSEALGVRMEKAGTALFSLSPEARQIFEIICGAYKKGNGGDGVSLYCQAWSAESYSCDRINRDSIYIPKAFLSALWLTQGDVITNLTQTPALMNSGFIARLLMFKANAPLQYDDGQTPREDDNIFYKWESFLLSLLDKRKGDVKTIQATPEAKAAFQGYYNKYIDEQQALKPYANLIAKSAEKAARLALLFAICNDADTITQTHARNACAVVDYCNSVMLDTFSSGCKARAVENRARIEAFFIERKETRLTFGQFRQYKRIEAEQLEQVAQEYPTLFKVEDGINKGKALLYTPQAM